MDACPFLQVSFSVGHQCFPPLAQGTVQRLPLTFASDSHSDCACPEHFPVDHPKECGLVVRVHWEKRPELTAAFIDYIYVQKAEVSFSSSYRNDKDFISDYCRCGLWIAGSYSELHV